MCITDKICNIVDKQKKLLRSLSSKFIIVLKELFTYSYFYVNVQTPQKEKINSMGIKVS